MEAHPPAPPTPPPPRRSLTPAEQVRLHHPGGGSFFVVERDTWTARRLRKWGKWLHDLEGMPGCYFTPNAFYPGSDRKTAANVSRLTCLFVDVDDHDTDGEVDPDSLLQAACDRLEVAGLPLPTYYTETGRGLHLFWLFDEPLPAAHFTTLYTKVGTALRTVLGADVDAVASSTAQLMRLSRTYNVKAGKTARSYTLTGQRYVFQTFIDVLLPVPAEQVRKATTPRPAKAPHKAGKPSLKYQRHYRRVTRFLDYIRACRGYETRLPEGQRHAFLYPYAVAFRHLYGAANGQAKAYEIAGRLTTLTSDELASRFVGVFDSATVARFRGGDLHGLRDRLQVTADEWTRFLDSEAERTRENDKARKAQERRDAGTPTRYEIAEQVQERATFANALRGLGLSVKDTAEIVGVSTRTVYAYARTERTEGANRLTPTPVSAEPPNNLNPHGGTVLHPPATKGAGKADDTSSDDLSTDLDHAPWLPSPPPGRLSKGVRAHGRARVRPAGFRSFRFRLEPVALPLLVFRSGHVTPSVSLFHAESVPSQNRR